MADKSKPRRNVQMYQELGTAGVPTFAGRVEERYMTDLRGPAGVEKMATILRKEPSAFTANRIVYLTAMQADWTAAPATASPEDRKAADFLDSVLKDMSHTFTQAVKSALSAQAFGFADLEIVWKRRQGKDVKGDQAQSEYADGLVGIRKLAIRRQETVDHWEIDENGGYQEMVQIDPSTGRQIPIPIDKLLHFIGGDDRGSWEGLGWLEASYGLWHQIENLTIIDGVGWQRSVVGVPTFKYVTVPDDADIAAVKDMGMGLAANRKQYVTIPASVDFSLTTVANPNSGALLDRVNQLRWEILSLACATFIRLGSTGASSKALANPLVDFFSEGIDAALDDIEDVLNRHLVPRLFAANAGQFSLQNGLPKIAHSKVTKPPMEVIQLLNSLLEYMMNAPEEDATWIRNTLGLPNISSEKQKQWREEAKKQQQAASSGDASKETLPESGAGAETAMQPGKGNPAPHVPIPAAKTSTNAGTPAKSASSAALAELAEVNGDLLIWAERQYRKLVKQGITPLAAENAVRQVLTNIPEGADPASWGMDGPQLGQLSAITDEDIRAARAAWYEDAPLSFKRILDARVREG
jgi:hypothetical protein